MSLFFYYTFHSFINQIKKLLKTWIAVVLIASFVLGLGIGLVGSMIKDKAEAAEGDTLIEEVLDEKVPFADRLYENTGLSIPRFAELIGGGLALVLLLFFTLSADNSDTSLFLPADAVLLFASPMKPQRVLRFRVMGNLGLALFMTIYCCLEIPMMKELGMPTLTALSVIISFGLCFAAGMLLQMLSFLLAEAHPFIKKNLTYLCLGLIALIAAVFFVYYQRSGLTLPLAADAFFNGRIARCVPLWGWIKAVPFLFWEGKNLYAVISLAASIAGIVILLLLTDHIRTDFYEEAIARSEKVSAMAEKLKASGGIFIGNSRKKDKNNEEKAVSKRPEKEYKDCYFKASGARLFFDKSMALRRRSALAGFFTKRSWTYLFIALLGMLGGHFFLDINNVIPAAALICLWVFFSTLGNPLLADIKTPYFRMAPGRENAKMFWSVFAGSVNCLLDMIPGMVLACICSIVFGEAPLPMLGLTMAGILFAASLDFYSSNVGAFIYLSTPDNAAGTLKQTIQILFLYFGLLPDLGIFAYGASVSEGLASFSLYIFIAVGVNFLLGLFFMAFSPLFLWPASRSPRDAALELSSEACRKEKKFFTRIGLALCALLIAANGVAFLLGTISERLPESLTQSPLFFWLCSVVPIYVIGVPAAWLLLKKLPRRPLERHPISVTELLKYFVIAEGLAYIANLIGNLVVLPVYYLADVEYENVVVSLVEQGNPLIRILFIVVIGPFFEELVFRKLLIDRLNVYGGRLAAITSAVLFGLFHCNIQQTLYAAVIGFIFAYVYQKTGSMLWPWILHMMINFNGSVLAIRLLGDGTEINWQMVIYLIMLICFIMLALVFSATGYRRMEFVQGEKLLPKGQCFSSVWLSLGMILFFVVTLVFAGLNIFM